MATRLLGFKNSQLQSLLILGLFLFFVAHFLLLSPSNLEEDFNGVRVVNPKDLLNFLQNESTTIAKPVPNTVAPSYSLRDLVFYNSIGAQSQWKLTARKANVYQVANLLHARDLILELQDGTQIHSKEGLVYINQNIIEFFGDVRVFFTNGTITYSEYLRAVTQPILNITIPLTEPVRGEKNNPDSRVEFTAKGFSYLDTNQKELKLLSNVIFNIYNDERTIVYSDRAIYNQLNNRAFFEMNDHQPLEKQFAEVKQPDLYLKARNLVIELGDEKQLQRIFANKDVYFKDTQDPEHISTGTSGRATYQEGKNVIYLEDFPQVYQDGDTITGEVIVYNRKTDMIEVKQSNATHK